MKNKQIRFLSALIVSIIMLFGLVHSATAHEGLVLEHQSEWSHVVFYTEYDTSGTFSFCFHDRWRTTNLPPSISGPTDQFCQRRVYVSETRCLTCDLLLWSMTDVFTIYHEFGFGPFPACIRCGHRKPGFYRIIDTGKESRKNITGGTYHG
ncbi:MAG: hypothetical protein FWC95_02155 [Defluviitaleaceae bacterium]|nr:hypothetical protein [Defluviitaleaceae bacterium]